MSEDDLAQLVGKTILEIHANSDRIVFITNDGTYGFVVVGDCCSESYFYDIVGVEKLLSGTVVSVEYIDHGEVETSEYGDVTESYGFKFVTEHPMFGEVTSALTFRNDSNGYYYGWSQPTGNVSLDGLCRITDDVLDIPSFVAEAKAVQA